MHSEDNITRLYCASAARFRLRSRSSAIVSLVPLPLGSETQGFVPSPMTKMLVILNMRHVIRLCRVGARRVLTVLQKYDPMNLSRARYQSHQYASHGVR